MREKGLMESGAKGRQTEKVSTPYSSWHRTLDKSLLMLDVDSIEWRYINDRLTPVGVIEETSVRHGVTVNEKYLASIVWRYQHRDLQGKATRRVANALDTKAYIVLYREDCSEFWVYGLTGNTGWTKYTPDEYEQFLLDLKPNE